MFEIPPVRISTGSICMSSNLLVRGPGPVQSIYHCHKTSTTQYMAIHSPAPDSSFFFSAFLFMLLLKLGTHQQYQYSVHQYRPVRGLTGALLVHKTVNLYSHIYTFTHTRQLWKEHNALGCPFA